MTVLQLIELQLTKAQSDYYKLQLVKENPTFVEMTKIIAVAARTNQLDVIDWDYVRIQSGEGLPLPTGTNDVRTSVGSAH